MHLQQRQLGGRWQLDRRRAGRIDIARKARQRRRRDAGAKRFGRDLLEGMGLIDDQHVVLGQDHRLATPGRTQREVGKVERVVDEHDLAPRRTLAGELGVAAIALGTARATAAIGTNGELTPDNLARHKRQLVTVAFARPHQPIFKPSQLAAVLLGHALVREGALDAADVIATALDDRCRNRQPRRGARQRQVLGQQLALQSLRRRRDDDALPTHGCRHEIGKALANACRSLGNQDASALDRGAHLFCQP